MSAFRRPKDPLAYLSHLVPRGTMSYFTRRGIGWVIRCPFCATVPPEYLTGYQKWRWLTGHIARLHHGKETIVLPKIGTAHGSERSLEPKQREYRANGGAP